MTKRTDTQSRQAEIIAVGKRIPAWLLDEFDEDDKSAYGDGAVVSDQKQKQRLIDKYFDGLDCWNYYGITLNKSWAKKIRQSNQSND